MKKILVGLSAVLTLGIMAACGGGGTPAAPPAGNGGGGDAAAPADTNDGGNGGGDTAEAPADAAGTLTWLSLGGTWEDHTRSILARYQEETGINVVFDGYPFNALFEIIEVRIAAGTSDFDVISVDVPMVASYATRGLISPLDAYFTADDKAQWIPSALAAGSWQGVFYAAPMNTSSQLLWYNVDLLAEGGVTVRDSDVNNRLTWEEIVDYATTALDVIDPDRNQGIEGIVFQQVGRTYQMVALAHSRGELGIGADGFTVDGVINTNGWVEAYTWWQNLYTDGLALRGFTPEDSSPNFNSGNILFMVGGTWTAGQIGDVNFAFAPHPAFRGFENQVGTPTGSWHFGINSGSEQHDLAADFIRFMSLGEGNDMWLGINNDVPSTLSAIAALEADAEANPIMAIAAFEAANTAVPRALTPGFPEYATILDATFDDIRNGADVRSALDEAVMRIDNAFERLR